jgi:hypothetical protein
LEIWLAWVGKSRQRSVCIDPILHLSACEGFHLRASFSLSFVPQQSHGRLSITPFIRTKYDSFFVL